MGPAEFAIKNRLMSFIVITLALIGGWQAYQTMPRFEDPEFTIRQAVVITPYPGATPEEVSNEVTEALGTAIREAGQSADEVRYGQGIDCAKEVSNHDLTKLDVQSLLIDDS